MKTLKQDDAVMKALDVKTIRRLICNTDKGALELMIRKGETKYFLTLDSVPLEADTNTELMEILFPVKVEVPQVNKLLKSIIVTPENVDKVLRDPNFFPPKNKGGRPKKAR